MFYTRHILCNGFACLQGHARASRFRDARRGHTSDLLLPCNCSTLLEMPTTTGPVVIVTPAQKCLMRWSLLQKRNIRCRILPTFGQVVNRIPSTGTMNPQITNVLNALNDLRNTNFGHGMTAPFQLSSAEGDFTYLSCVSGI